MWSDPTVRFIKYYIKKNNIVIYYRYLFLVEFIRRYDNNML